MITYKKLFEVKIFHEFYDAFNRSDIEIAPSTSANKLIAMYALVYRATDDGLIVLYKEEKGFLLEQLKERLTFSFFLKLKNRHFGNFTHLDYALGEERFYFKNYDPYVLLSERSEQVTYALHQDQRVSTLDVMTSIEPSSLLTKAVSPGSCVFGKDTEIVFQGEVNDDSIASAALGSDYGLYSILSEDSGKRNEAYYSPPLMPEVFGIIDLFLGSSESISFSSVTERSYEIRFGSRKVYWTYFFIGDTNNPIKSVNISSGKQAMAFSEPQLVRLINGQEAIKVTSEEPLPLKKFYNGDKLFATISNSSSNFSEKRIRLPLPDVNRVKGSFETGVQKFFSEMYVYV